MPEGPTSGSLQSKTYLCPDELMELASEDVHVIETDTVCLRPPFTIPPMKNLLPKI